MRQYVLLIIKDYNYYYTVLENKNPWKKSAFTEYNECKRQDKIETPKRESIVLIMSKTSVKEICVLFSFFKTVICFYISSNYCSCTDKDDNNMLNEA